MIVMKSNRYLITKILKKTGRELFKNLNVGDSLIFSLPVRPTGIGRSAYVAYITVTHVETGNTTLMSPNQSSILQNFELSEQVNDIDSLIRLTL